MCCPTNSTAAGSRVTAGAAAVTRQSCQQGSAWCQQISDNLLYYFSKMLYALLKAEICSAFIVKIDHVSFRLFFGLTGFDVVRWYEYIHHHHHNAILIYNLTLSHNLYNTRPRISNEYLTLRPGLKFVNKSTHLNIIFCVTSNGFLSQDIITTIAFTWLN